MEQFFRRITAWNYEIEDAGLKGIVLSPSSSLIIDIGNGHHSSTMSKKPMTGT